MFGSKNEEKFVIRGAASAILIAGVFTPFKAFAEIQDYDGTIRTVRRKTTTNYHTTIELDGELVDINDSLIDTYSKTSTEYDANYDALNTEIAAAKADFEAWFTSSSASLAASSEDIDSYYYDVHDEVTLVDNDNRETACDGVEGDCEIGDIVINTVLDKHQTYLINSTAKVSLISVVNLDIEAPVAGETNTIVETDIVCLDTYGYVDCNEKDSYEPVVSTSTSKVNILNARWMAEDEDGDYDYFEGTFEEGKDYYLAVDLAVDEDATDYKFAELENLSILANGEEAIDAVDTPTQKRVFALLKVKATTNNPDTFDGINIIFGVLGTSTLAGSALFLSKSKRH